MSEPLATPHRTGDELRIGPPVTVAVIGPGDLVDQVMSVSTATNPAARLVGAPYHDERDAARIAASVGNEVDVLLFTGPAPYDLALSADVVDTPATYIALNGEALYRALLTVRLTDGPDLRNLSIDTLGQTEVAEVYDELGLDVDDIKLRPYQKGSAAAEVAAWHAELIGRGTASAALTCRRAVHTELVRRELPVWRVMPTRQSIIATVTTAILLGSGHRAERSRIALCLVELDRFDATVRQSRSVHWMHEMRLALHRTLLEEAQQLGATVVPLATGQFLVITTLGALRVRTNDFVVAPFVDAVDRALGQRVSVGIGAATTAHDAEAAAYVALDAARSDGGGTAYLRSHDGSMRRFGRIESTDGDGPGQAPALATPADHDANHERRLNELARLHHALAGDAGTDTPLTVDTGTAASALGLSLRSARRLLRSLAKEGLAWPVVSDPAARGRPQHRYRLASHPDGEGRRVE